MTETLAFRLLCELFGAGDESWWKFHRLLGIATVARQVAEGRNEETRYWLTVYERLRRCR